MCDQCNQSLGNSIDQLLCRDSYEGTLRYRFGLTETPQKQGDRFRPRRVTFQAKNDGNPPDWQGIHLELKGIDETGNTITDPPPQAGFHVESGEIKYFTESEIPSPNELGKMGITHAPIRIVSLSEDGALRIEKKLKELGFELDERRREKVSEGPTKIFSTQAVTIDNNIRRGLCKIAVNYLAAKLGAGFVLKSDFDPIREFIVTGQEPPWTIHVLSKEPFLHSDRFRKSRPIIHLIGVGWDDTRRGIVARVSLFNSLMHQLTLVPRARTIIRHFAFANAFDPFGNQVLEILQVPTRLIP